ncbi:metallophosphoesterase [Polyangium sp. y55x31]|uniref:metallophosphoesterase family protein n=1 Tax=Polyangium sp. y55x31 TaxID=3042688 RepID=UPI0024823C77|nr:metallophosphoesterase [Polyangium sp. y55x31]MDI1479212.1 metallophosphoesterase [Polyangium sp. y55x31]
MTSRRLVHLSDLHLGSSTAGAERAAALVRRLESDGIDHVVVTGDLTHQGEHAEARRFQEVFAPLLRKGRVTFIPGNHDRTGEDAGGEWMQGRRVRVEERPGLYLVCVDSTAPHNRSYFQTHGELSRGVLMEVDAALDDAPSGALVAVLLHHHVLPLPEDSPLEWLIARLGSPVMAELSLGAELVERIRGRSDLVLHGHRHTPRAFDLSRAGERGLCIFNAGSSTEFGGYRVFEHENGRLSGRPSFCSVIPRAATRFVTDNMFPALQHLARNLYPSDCRGKVVRAGV